MKAQSPSKLAVQLIKCAYENQQEKDGNQDWYQSLVREEGVRRFPLS